LRGGGRWDESGEGVKITDLLCDCRRVKQDEREDGERRGEERERREEESKGKTRPMGRGAGPGGIINNCHLVIAMREWIRRPFGMEETRTGPEGLLMGTQ
jgi:hypothetical protein